MAIQVNLRVSDELREKLIEASDARGVSMNKEINDRLERTFEDDTFVGSGKENAALLGVLNVVASAMTAAGQAAGFFSTYTFEGAQKWLDDAFAFDRAIDAAIVVLDASRPPGEPKPPETMPPALAESVMQYGKGFANAVLEEAATGRARTPGMMARAKILHQSIGPEIASRLLAAGPREPLMVQLTGPGNIFVEGNTSTSPSGGANE